MLVVSTSEHNVWISTLEATGKLINQGQADRDFQKDFASKDQVIEIGHEVLRLGVHRVSAGAFSGAVCC